MGDRARSLVLADNVFVEAPHSTAENLDATLQEIVRELEGPGSSPRGPVSVCASWGKGPSSHCGAAGEPADAAGTVARWVWRMMERVGRTAALEGTRVKRVVWITPGTLLPPRSGARGVAAPLYGFLRELCREGGASLTILEVGDRTLSCIPAWSRALGCDVGSDLHLTSRPNRCKVGCVVSPTGDPESTKGYPIWQGRLRFGLRCVNPYVSYNSAVPTEDVAKDPEVSVPGFSLLSVDGAFKEWGRGLPRGPIDVLYLAPGKHLPVHYLLHVGKPVILLPDKKSSSAGSAKEILEGWPLDVAIVCRTSPEKGEREMYIFLHAAEAVGLRGVIVDTGGRTLEGRRVWANHRVLGGSDLALNPCFLHGLDDLAVRQECAERALSEHKGGRGGACDVAPETSFLCKIVPEESTRSQRRASLQGRKRAREAGLRKAQCKISAEERLKPLSGELETSPRADDVEGILETVVRDRLLHCLGPRGDVHPHHDFLLTRALSACRSALGMDESGGIPGIMGALPQRGAIRKVADAQCALLVGLFL